MSTVNATGGANTTDEVTYTLNTGVDKIDGENDVNNEFAALLNKALDEFKNTTVQNALNPGALTGMAGTGSAGLGSTLAMPDQFLSASYMNNSLEQAILTASSTGNSDDAMVALLMLMMMMQSGSGGGDMSMLMPMMASMVEQMQDKDTLRDRFLYSSGGEPYTLDTIDTQVFKNKLPDTTGTYKAELPLQWWRPATPAIVSGEYDRSPALYRTVIDQFDVENAERYRPGREGNTYCNIYVWDVTRAMGAELPYYTDPKTGAPIEYPDTKGANVNGAIAMDRWLKTFGSQYGWREVTAEEAQYHANQGKPAVTAAGDVGHVQMVAPSENGLYDPIKGPVIAQAGRINTRYKHISDIYSAASLKNKVTYWIHE